MGLLSEEGRVVDLVVKGAFLGTCILGAAFTIQVREQEGLLVGLQAAFLIITFADHIAPFIRHTCFLFDVLATFTYSTFREYLGVFQHELAIALRLLFVLVIITATGQQFVILQFVAILENVVAAVVGCIEDIIGISGGLFTDFLFVLLDTFSICLVFRFGAVKAPLIHLSVISGTIHGT